MHSLTTVPGASAPEITELGPIELGPSDLRIQVEAATVNPIDVFVATEQGRSVFGLPAAVGLGWDLAGTVIEVGSAVDAFAYNFRVMVPHDACYDRSATSHAVNLFDLASKYADVVSTDDAIKSLKALA